MSDSIQASSPGKPGFTRRRFIIGTVGVGAASVLAGTVVRPPRALAATAPSGPPTTTLPLPTTTAPEQLLLTWGNDPAREVTVSWSAPGTVAQPAPTLAFSTQPITARNPGRLVKLPDPAPLDVTRALRRRRLGQLHRRAQRADHVLLPRPADRPVARNAVLLPGQRRGGHAVHRGRLVRDRAVRPGEVPLLQLRRPVHPVVGPQLVGQHLARVLRQLLVRGDRHREPRRRQGRAAFPPAQRRPVLRQPGHIQRAWRLAGLRQQRGPQRRQPAVDAGPRQPRDRVRRRQPRRGDRRRPRRDRRAGSGGELLERPVRLRPLPEPVPAAGQRPGQLGRQPAAGELLRLPGRHGEVHLARRRRRDLPGRRLRLPQLGRERRPGDHLLRRGDPQRDGHLQPRLHRQPRARREEQLAGARLLGRQAEPADALA